MIEVQLSHFSVKEWLISNRQMTSLPASFSMEFNPSTGNAAVAMVCIAYLLELDTSQIKDFGLAYGSWKTPLGEKEYPFARYSAQFWSIHAATSEKSSESVVNMALELLMSLDHFKASISLHYFPKRSPKPPPSRSLLDAHHMPPSALYFVSEKGLLHTSRKLIERGAFVNERGGYLGRALFAACSGGHEAIIQLLLDEGADIDAESDKPSEGQALHVAIFYEQESIIPLLLKKGADVNTTGGGKWRSAIQMASEQGLKGTVELLLRWGADVNASRGQEFGAPIQIASGEGHKDIVQLLLDNGADVNANQGKRLSTPIQIASIKGHEGIVRLLLDNGADVNLVCDSKNYGNNALQSALYSGHMAIVTLLVDNGAKLFMHGEDNTRTLQAASYAGQNTIVQLLLENNVNINATCKGPNGVRGALQAASYAGHLDIVRLLLDNGADVTARAGDRLGALERASYAGHKAIVELLLKKGVGVFREDDYMEAISSAIVCDREEIRQLLIENIDDIDLRRKCFHHALLDAIHRQGTRNLPLLLKMYASTNTLGRGCGGEYLADLIHMASLYGPRDAVQTLLDERARVNAPRAKGLEEALVGASSRGRKHTVKLLLENGVNADWPAHRDGNNALQDASSKGFDDVVRLLLENGASVDAPGPQGGRGNALHQASLKGHESTVRILLDKGADVNSQDSGYISMDWLLFHDEDDSLESSDECTTALLVASSCGHSSIVRLLLDHGAHVDAEFGNKGITALHVASSHGHSSIVHLLLDRGAHIDAEFGDERTTALQMASSRNHSSVVQLLLERGAKTDGQGSASPGYEKCKRRRLH